MKGNIDEYVFSLLISAKLSNLSGIISLVSNIVTQLTISINSVCHYHGTYNILTCTCHCQSGYRGKHCEHRVGEYRVESEQ